MEFKEFQRLYMGNRVVFMLAMELFLENGRTILEHSEEDLVQVVRNQLSNLFVPEMANEVVRVSKEFSQMKTVDLLAYASKCEIHLEEKYVDISGVCPVCGGPLIYGENASADSSDTAGWVCQDCGATGKEIYRQVFDHHQDVRLGDGRPVPLREK